MWTKCLCLLRKADTTAKKKSLIVLILPMCPFDKVIMWFHDLNILEDRVDHYGIKFLLCILAFYMV